MWSSGKISSLLPSNQFLNSALLIYNSLPTFATWNTWKPVYNPFNSIVVHAIFTLMESEPKEKEAATESSSNIPRSKNRPKYDFPLKLGITAVLSSSFLFFHTLTLASQLQNLAAYQKIRYRNNTKNQYIALQLVPRLHHSMSNIQHFNGCIIPCGNMIFQLHLAFHSDPLHNLFKLITS